MKLPIGLILMVLGIIGIAQGSVDYMSLSPSRDTVAAEHTRNFPVAPLAAAFLFVGGLMKLAKRDVFSVERSSFFPEAPSVAGNGGSFDQTGPSSEHSSQLPGDLFLPDCVRRDSHASR